MGLEYHLTLMALKDITWLQSASSYNIGESI